jgi:hypothetical protein
MMIKVSKKMRAVMNKIVICIIIKMLTQIINKELDHNSNIRMTSQIHSMN